MGEFFDAQEKKIIKELVRDPRLSDNQIAIRTKIPVKTVNRKRKKLEEKGIINYYVGIDNSETGSGVFGARRFYVVTFRYGISRCMFLEKFPNMGLEHVESKHVEILMSGEHDGRFALILLVESRVWNDIIEIFNIEIVGRIKHHFGHDAIHDTIVIPVDNYLRVHHNYLPGINMKNGKIKKDWPDNKIFI
ncbi:winged helix-turn-helix transcriptional regulator [Candidatus Woesearchaeota archaeon]|nr:winged helix-turn-helix transcriptional regulator [Candidatus Woesearchaeota archaeon]